MTDRVRAAFRAQGKSCAMLGSPFMGRLMPLLADRLAPTNPVAQRILDWPGDVGPGGQSVPLRTAGALHGLVLDGSDANLIAAYPPGTVSDAALWDAVDGALHRHETRIMRWLDHAPQTNEVRRAAALIPAIWWALAQYDRPVVLSELGASAGLNLSLDRFGLSFGGADHGAADSPVRLHTDWQGPHPAPLSITVTDRAGVDLNPLDVTDAAGQLRLLAFVWPDQPARMALMRGAMASSDTRPDRGDAADWLARRLSTHHPGHLHVVYHTIAWQYFPTTTQDACRAALAQAAERATEDAPLAHIALEADGDAKGAALTAQVWPPKMNASGPVQLARADYHGRWINWQE
jgi:PTH1 family peptidyl-tRNA hydrolase